MGGIQRLLHAGDAPALGPLDREEFQHKPLPGLCHIKGFCGSA